MHHIAELKTGPHGPIFYVVKVVGVTQMPRICRSAPLSSVGLNHSLLNRPPDAFAHAPALSGSTPSVYIT